MSAAPLPDDYQYGAGSAAPLEPASSLLDRLEARPAGPLVGDIFVPGDKSMSHRALVLGALASGETQIAGLLESEDVLATLKAVQAFGASVERSGDEWLVRGTEWHTPDRLIDCGNSGTSARLLMGAAAGFPLRAHFTGDDSLCRRPMQRVVEPLRQMGAKFDGSYFLPIGLRGGALRGISHSSAVASAQVKSAILLAGLGANEVVEVTEMIPSRDHTEVMLSAFGCDVEICDTKLGRRVALGTNRSLRGTQIHIPGDPSSAAFLIVAALITPGSHVTVRNIIDSPTRNGLLITLLEMGAFIYISNQRTCGGVALMDVTARFSRLNAVRVPASRSPSMIDEYPILAIAAAHATGVTIMENLAELRKKESDRLVSIEAGLKRCNVDARIEGETLYVTGNGRPPRGGAFVTTRGDHRIAMAFLVMGLSARNAVTVDETQMIATSFPDFSRLISSLGGAIESCETDYSYAQGRNFRSNEHQ